MDSDGYDDGYDDGYGYGSGYGSSYGTGDGFGFGVGYGYGIGYGSGSGVGYGYGTDSGSGSGVGYGYGTGHGAGYGDGYGYGDGSGYGYGYGDGAGSGSGIGYGYGYVSGYGIGYGIGDGVGYGCGYSAGYGYGIDSREWLRAEFLRATRDLWPAVHALTIQNTEFRREVLEAMGPDRLFSQSAGQIIHQDVDRDGNERALMRVACEDTQDGYLQAVRVVCPTTHRVYHLLVPPHVITCEEAVASTFDVEDYSPIRES